MKKPVFSIILISVMLMTALSTASRSEENNYNEFSREFEAMVPLPNSSVDSDYKIGQIALGNKYTVKMLNQLYEQGRNNNDRYDAMLSKYDEIIRQNEEIIKHLSIISEKCDCRK